VGKQKLPFRILPENGELMVMGGIWDRWYGEGKTLETFSILTTEPNQEMMPIHNRMPLIFTQKEQYQRWLEPAAIDDLMSMLQVTPDHYLTIYPVATTVNSVRNNGAELHDRVERD
jgi:putative SOS response-associated peptidase YedK